MDLQLEIKSVLVPCKICNKESKYRCPKCLLRTCSLECCIRHKLESDCDGKRDRVAYIPLHQYSDSSLLSDYFFLEDAITKRERGKNLIKNMGLDMGTGLKKRMREEDEANKSIPLNPLCKLKIQDPLELNLSFECENAEQYPNHKQKLVQKAKDYGVTLLLMPPGMQRHISNTSTKYDAKTKTFYWKVEFIFHISNEKDGNSSKLILHLEKVSGEDILKTRLENLLETKVIHSAAVETRSALRPFCMGTNRLKETVITLMKKIPCTSSNPLYRKVDINQPLHNLLQGTTVIEYPSFDVILSDSIDKFPLVITEM